jgi:predicted transcriptional regulator
MYDVGMNKQDLIKLAGSQRELAKLLGISQPAVSSWKQVPQARIWQLKVIKPEWFKEQA